MIGDRGWRNAYRPYWRDRPWRNGFYYRRLISTFATKNATIELTCLSKSALILVLVLFFLIDERRYQQPDERRSWKITFEHHLLSTERNLTPPHELAEDMIDLVRAYLK